MELLEQRILKDGQVFPGRILKVDSFLNHQMDVKLLCEIGKEFKRIFSVLFAKKTKTKNIANAVYKTQVKSYTHGTTYDVIVSKDFLNKGDKVLIIDDFLAEGNALMGLIDLCKQAGAEVAGCGIAIEKGFQPGSKRIRGLGVRVVSLAVIESMDDGSIQFRS